VQAEQGLVQNVDGQFVAQISDLPLNVPFSIGQIRLCVTRADQPWPKAPVVTAPEPAPASEAPPTLTLSSISRSQQKRLISLVVVGAVIITAIGMVTNGERQAQASLMPPVVSKHELGSPYEVRQQF